MVRRWSKLVAVVAMMAVTSALTAQETGLCRQDLIDGRWRLTGMIFATTPAGGPITFRSDSTVLTSNLGGVTMWSLTDGVLRLLGSSGTLYYRFD